MSAFCHGDNSMVADLLSTKAVAKETSDIFQRRHDDTMRQLVVITLKSLRMEGMKNKNPNHLC